jgi:hypothetical protein
MRAASQRWSAPTMSVIDAVDGPPPRHRNVPKRNRDSLIVGFILAFAEGLLLAKSRRQRLCCFTSAFGGNPAVKGQ